MTFTIRSGPDVELEARWDAPADPTMAAVFCHPNPRERGTMTAPLMTNVTKGLVDRGIAVLRFNFRGVGRSTGDWADGIGEIDDAAAAVETASLAYPDLPLGIAGWSFGSVVALNWQARSRSELPYVGIAPAVRSDDVPNLPEPEGLAPARRSFVLGDRDQFTTVQELEGYAAAIGAEVEVLAGSDHFFYFREGRVAEVTATGLLGE